MRIPVIHATQRTANEPTTFEVRSTDVDTNLKSLSHGKALGCESVHPLTLKQCELHRLVRVSPV